MFRSIVSEFKRSPAATSAAYLALASALFVVVLSAASLPLPPTGAEPALVSKSVRLLLVGLFAMTASYGVAQLLNVIPAVSARYCVSLGAAILVQAATAVVMLHLLSSQFVVSPARYGLEDRAVAQTNVPVASVAGVGMSALVFTLSALIALIFVGVTLGWVEKKHASLARDIDAQSPEEKRRSDDVGAMYVVFGALWVAVVRFIGGRVMETLLRAGV